VDAGQIALTWPGDSYAFRCPSCGEGITKDCTANIRTLLEKHGVRMMGTPPPYPETKPGNLRPLTLDDIIDFHYELDAL
jgi:hypothetical protein